MAYPHQLHSVITCSSSSTSSAKHPLRPTFPQPTAARLTPPYTSHTAVYLSNTIASCNQYALASHRTPTNWTQRRSHPSGASDCAYSLNKNLTSASAYSQHTPLCATQEHPRYTGLNSSNRSFGNDGTTSPHTSRSGWSSNKQTLFSARACVFRRLRRTRQLRD